MHGLTKPEPSGKQKEAMQHGVDNKLNAISTIVSKILQVYFRQVDICEEGFVKITSNQDDRFMMVSSDGMGYDIIKHGHGI